MQLVEESTIMLIDVIFARVFISNKLNKKIYLYHNVFFHVSTQSTFIEIR